MWFEKLIIASNNMNEVYDVKFSPKDYRTISSPSGSALLSPTISVSLSIGISNDKPKTIEILQM